MDDKDSLVIGIIGAGPAGLAAAGAAVQTGATVIVIDANDQPGGQYFRHLSEAAGIPEGGELHHSWKEYLALRASFDKGITQRKIEYFPHTQVFMCQQLGPRGQNSRFSLRLSPSTDCGTTPPVNEVVVDRLIVATGCFDRHVPIPGWDVPGVMAAGGIQAIIKGQGVLPGKKFVLAGTGPFLLPVASNILAAGGQVAAICESSAMTQWAPFAHYAAALPEKAIEGVQYMRDLVKHKVKFYTRTVVAKIHESNGEVSGVTVLGLDETGKPKRISERFIEADTVGLGFGFVPQLELLSSLGVNTWEYADGNTVAAVNKYQSTSVWGVWAAGEVTGVGGATLAISEGFIAGCAAANPNGIANGRGVAKHLSRISKHRRFADAMHRVHPVPEAWMSLITQDTVVCRCEEVHAGEIQQAVELLGATDQRAIKMVTRAGMGWCQGRICGYASACFGGTAGQGALKRPVSIPVDLQALANMFDSAQ